MHGVARRHKPEQIRQHFLGVSESATTVIFPALVSRLPRCSTSLDSFSAYSSRLNRARAFQLIALPRPCVLSCCPLFLQRRVRTVDTVEANSGHNKSACHMMIEGHTPSRTRISRVVYRSLCPTGNRHACWKCCLSVVRYKNPLTPRFNVLFRPIVRVGELSDLVRQDHPRPTGDTIS